MVISDIFVLYLEYLDREKKSVKLFKIEWKSFHPYIKVKKDYIGKTLIFSSTCFCKIFSIAKSVSELELAHPLQAPK